jgi:hypothetical protein
MQLESQFNQRLNARAARSTYLVFGVISTIICGAPIAITVDNWLHRRFELPSDAAILFFFTIAFLLAFIWVRRFQILVSDNELSYRTLFGGTRKIPLSEVESAETILSVGNLFGPVYRLVIKSKHAAQPIVINMKIFSRIDLQNLLTILAGKVVGKPTFSAISKNQAN